MNYTSISQKVKNAIKDINAMESVAEVQAYIAGDERPDVLDAAKLQTDLIEKTSPSPPDGLKQGEEPGALTKDVQDFKGGIQKTKSAAPLKSPLDTAAKSEVVTGSDIVEKIDEADKERADRNAAPASEQVKGQDIMEQIDEADERRALDLERQAAQEERDRKAGKINPDIVTAEAVIKQMRAAGRKI